MGPGGPAHNERPDGRRAGARTSFLRRVPPSTAPSGVALAPVRGSRAAIAVAVALAGFAAVALAGFAAVAAGGLAVVSGGHAGVRGAVSVRRGGFIDTVARRRRSRFAALGPLHVD